MREKKEEIKFICIASEIIFIIKLNVENPN